MFSITFFKCIALRSLQMNVMLEVSTCTGGLVHEIESENKYSITKIISHNNYLKWLFLGLWGNIKEKESKNEETRIFYRECTKFEIV